MGRVDGLHSPTRRWSSWLGPAQDGSPVRVTPHTGSGTAALETQAGNDVQGGVDTTTNNTFEKTGGNNHNQMFCKRDMAIVTFFNKRSLCHALFGLFESSTLCLQMIQNGFVIDAVFFLSSAGKQPITNRLFSALHSPFT